MANKSIRASLTKHLAVVALLSSVLGMQIAAYAANPMNPCQNGANWIAPNCSTDKRGVEICISAKCHTLYADGSSGESRCETCALLSYD